MLQMIVDNLWFTQFITYGSLHFYFFCEQCEKRCSYLAELLYKITIITRMPKKDSNTFLFLWN